MRKRDWGYTVIIAIISGLIIFWLTPNSAREISRSARDVAATTANTDIEFKGQRGTTILNQLKLNHKVVIDAGQIKQIDNIPCTNAQCWQLSVDDRPVSNVWLNIDAGNYSLIKFKYETIQRK